MTLKQVTGLSRHLLQSNPLQFSSILTVSLSRNSVAVLERKVRMLMKKIDNENESTEEKTENEEEKVGSGEKEGVESKENSTTLR